MNLFLIFQSIQKNRTIALNSDKKIQSIIPAGGLEIVPQGSDISSMWLTPKENMLIALPNERLRSLAGLECGEENLEIYPLGLAISDRKAYAISRAIGKELALQEIGRAEYLDALLTAFGVHIIRNYSNLSSGFSARRAQGGLSPQKWKKIEAYIRENISAKMTIESLAVEVSLSPGHFSRAFKETSGMSPHQFILNMRLSLARGLLEKPNVSFSEVARISGFASNSHMTAVMKRFLGATPSDVRKKRVAI
ncbi:helix-turn-helix domain-containing protein [Comamonas serinivorans]|uniref:helix-turn-helix domain-containing protein n=1 Tax=Comamonas serinivorans TaxID=1082851 RepID=UPI0012F92796|nr:AraC family transcriptional regulator [Comamonas serinivorans]